MMSNKERWSEFFLENGSYKFVALVIAFILWVTVLGRRDVVLTRSVDIELIHNSQVVIANDVATQVDFKISGSRFAIKKFQKRSLEPIKIDISNLEVGSRLVPIPDDSLRLPVGMRVLAISPQSLFVELAKLEGKSVPVIIDDQAMKAEGYLVERIEPAQVLVKGAPKVVSNLEQIRFEIAGGKFDALEVKAHASDSSLAQLKTVEPTQVKVFLKKVK